MIGWLILAVYWGGYVLTWRRVVWALANDGLAGRTPDGGDVVFSLVIGSMINLAWPAIAVGLSVRAVYHRRAGDALYALMPRNVRRERELEARERHIRELEIANGMDPVTGKFREGAAA